MGHANIEKISLFVRKHMKQHGKASIKELQLAFSAAHPKSGVEASEGLYTEDFMIREAIMHIIAFWHGQSASSYSGHSKLRLDRKPVVEPHRITKTQRKVYDQWVDEEHFDWDCDEDNPKAEGIIFDSIEWELTKHWKNKRNIPLLGSINN